MNKITVLAGLAAATISTSAFAQNTGEADNGGFFVGTTAGYDVINLEAGNNDFDDTGVVYGITAGYDADTGKALFGIEAEISDTSISDEVGEAGVDLYGGVRVGYEMDANDIIYLKAGYTNVDVDLAERLEGVRVGAGFEHNFGRFVSRVEYRYSTYDVSDTIAPGVNGNRHQAVVTIGGKF